jgi:hypothetical protein
LDVGGFDAGYFQAVAGYLSYKISDKATISGRAEYANGQSLGALADADNFFYAGGTPANPLSKVFALTGTFEYDLWANVMSRIEARWDHSMSGGNAFGGTDVGGPTSSNEILLAANIIYKF